MFLLSIAPTNYLPTTQMPKCSFPIPANTLLCISVTVADEQDAELSSNSPLCFQVAVHTSKMLSPGRKTCHLSIPWQ